MPWERSVTDFPARGRTRLKDADAIGRAAPDETSVARKSSFLDLAVLGFAVGAYGTIIGRLTSPGQTLRHIPIAICAPDPVVAAGRAE
ncbi:MAG: hypothetical protein A2Y74_04600 [Actinobacteria bacterium RBG_13_63_9]|nr:MAG: hypothetical protein A2Y74_04600 [Actinobacteria bacterium RBG_13_63_9]